MNVAPPLPQRVYIPGPSGDLQAIVEEPAATPTAFAVLCHQHPLHGGTMNNKVIHILARTFNELGVPALRFNYRGVGESVGSYGNGIGETDDALAAIEWARKRWPNTPLWLAGASFGGGVVLRAALRTEVARLIMIAPAAAREAAPAQLPQCPWLIVQGDADEVIPAGMVIDWVKRLHPRPELQLMAGAGHFFHGRLNELRDTVRAWLEQQAALQRDPS